MVERLWEAFSQDEQKIIREIYSEAYADDYANLQHKGLPEYEKAGARLRFVMIAVAINKYLIIAESEARKGHDTN